MYIINEYQTNGNETAIVTPAQEADWDRAQSKCYEKCMYAAISQVETHTVILTDHEGIEYEKKIFRHNAG